MSIFGLSTLKIKTELSKLGLLGSSLKKMTLAMENLEPFHRDFNECILPKSYFVKDHLSEIISKEQKLKKLYREHNKNVIENVPKENLLVWNVSIGFRSSKIQFEENCISNPFQRRLGAAMQVPRQRSTSNANTS